MAEKENDFVGFNENIFNVLIIFFWRQKMHENIKYSFFLKNNKIIINIIITKLLDIK